MHILHHGAWDGVTGSCHQLIIDAQHSLLIDCGMFRGAGTSADGRSDAGRLAIGFDIASVKAVIATHVQSTTSCASHTCSPPASRGRSCAVNSRPACCR